MVISARPCKLTIYCVFYFPTDKPIQQFISYSRYEFVRSSKPSFWKIVLDIMKICAALHCSYVSSRLFLSQEWYSSLWSSMIFLRLNVHMYFSLVSNRLELLPTNFYIAEINLKSIGYFGRFGFFTTHDSKKLPCPLEYQAVSTEQWNV